ncbi:WD40 repeat-like protein [Aureobasidium pullulans]|nr:WD40 repeat-like protein [Aureobasidium pullulans]
MDFEAQPYHLAFRAHHGHVVTCLLLDSERILTGSDDANIHLYDARTGALQRKFEGHEGAVWAIQHEADILVSGSTDQTIRVWDITSGKCLHVFQGHTSTVRCLAILQPVKMGTTSDGSTILMPKQPLIISGSRDSTMRVWKLPYPDDRQTYQASPPDGHSDDVHSLRILAGHQKTIRAMAAYGDTVVSGSFDCTVRVWKVSTGEMVHCLAGHLQKIFSVVLDHVSSRCVSGSMDNSVKIWSIETGNCLFNLDGHTSLVGLLELSQGVLVSGAADGTLRTWDLDDGGCRAILKGHTGAITCFQHDLQKVVSGSDRTLKLWDTQTGECLRDLLSELSGVWQVRFDERRCVAAVQRNNLTYIEVLDFGAARDEIPESKRGHRIVVDLRGREVEKVETGAET